MKVRDMIRRFALEKEAQDMILNRVRTRVLRVLTHLSTVREE